MRRVEEKRKGVPVDILMDDNSMFHTIVFIIAVYLKFKKFLKNYDNGVFPKSFKTFLT